MKDEEGRLGVRVRGTHFILHRSSFIRFRYGVFGVPVGLGTALSCERTWSKPFRWAIRGPKRSTNSLSMNSPSSRFS